MNENPSPTKPEGMRHALRHFLATLAYRGTNVLSEMPSSAATVRPCESVRTPLEILNHINGVLTYAHSFMNRSESTELPLVEWSAEVDRFFEVLQRLDDSLAEGVALKNVREEQLLQGPFADAMLHLGQIGIFRRMTGSPVASENYVFAPVTVGRLKYA